MALYISCSYDAPTAADVLLIQQPYFVQFIDFITFFTPATNSKE